MLLSHFTYKICFSKALLSGIIPVLVVAVEKIFVSFNVVFFVGDVEVDDAIKKKLIIEYCCIS